MNEKLNNVEWSFTQETGCLTITGTGKMQNWAEHQERPWEEISIARAFSFIPIR